MTIPPLPPGLIDPKDEADRLAWCDKLTRYASDSGVQLLRVARRIDGARQVGAKTYFHISRGVTPRFHLRTCLPTCITFDLGDLQAGDPKPGNWSRCRRESDAIASACTTLSVPFTMALTSGKGIHIELWLDPKGPQTLLDVRGTCANCFHAHEGRCPAMVGLEVETRCPCHELVRLESRDDRGLTLAENENYRHHISRRIIAEAKRILWPDDEDARVAGRIYFDPLFISPNEGSELLTEFSERKGPTSPHRKVLWHEGYGPAPPLPADREEAYLVAEARAKLRGSPRPTNIPVAREASRFDTRWVQEQTGKPCPSGPACYEPSDYGTCEGCPAWG